MQSSREEQEEIKKPSAINAKKQRKITEEQQEEIRKQCKEIEENNRMGKTRNLFKKIKDIKGHFMQRWAQ